MRKKKTYIKIQCHLSHEPAIQWAWPKTHSQIQCRLVYVCIMCFLPLFSLISCRSMFLNHFSCHPTKRGSTTLCRGLVHFRTKLFCFLLAMVMNRNSYWLVHYCLLVISRYCCLLLATDNYWFIMPLMIIGGNGESYPSMLLPPMLSTFRSILLTPILLCSTFHHATSKIIEIPDIGLPCVTACHVRVTNRNSSENMQRVRQWWICIKTYTSLESIPANRKLTSRE